jgi:hypothetical protein
MRDLDEEKGWSRKRYRTAWLFLVLDCIVAAGLVAVLILAAA